MAEIEHQACVRLCTPRPGEQDVLDRGTWSLFLPLLFPAGHRCLCSARWLRMEVPGQGPALCTLQVCLWTVMLMSSLSLSPVLSLGQHHISRLVVCASDLPSELGAQIAASLPHLPGGPAQGSQAGCPGNASSGPGPP